MTVVRFQPVLAPLTREQQRLVLDHQGSAQTMTRRYRRRYRGLLGDDDVKQLVDTGLAEAARAFKPNEGTPFSFFAWKRVCGSVIAAAKDEVRHRDAARRAAEACLDMQEDDVEIEDTADVLVARTETLAARISMAMMLGVATQAAAEDAAGAEALFIDRDYAQATRAALASTLATLSVRRRKLIELYYFQNRELREVAPLLDVGYSTARREHNEALDQLRAGLRARGIGA